MEKIKSGDVVLLVSEKLEQLTEIKTAIAAKGAEITSKTFDNLKDISPCDAIVIVQYDSLEKYLSNLFDSLKPQGVFILKNVLDAAESELNLKIIGFTNVEKIEENGFVCTKPNYQVGSGNKLNLKKPAAVWKLDDDEAEETIDPDNLLDEDDLKKPTSNSLKVCATTGKRKACKDCSCGLAEELAGDVKSGPVDTTDAPKSSCGSCYLGDAFRCASCPYLGMPAFKPGDKIQLAGNLLKDDI